MSKHDLGAYINFQGRAREAIEFYLQVLGGKLDLETLDAKGMAKPAGPGDRIAHARLESDGALIFASDGHPNYPPINGDNIGIAVGGRDLDRMTGIFHVLAEGGRSKMPPTGVPLVG